MKKLHYRKEDLLTKKEFVLYCCDKGYAISEVFLNSFKASEMLFPVLSKGGVDYYSKFQLYFVIEIIDNRYDTYFHRTQFSIEQESEEIISNINKVFKEYDRVYKDEIYPTFVDFFNMFYSICEDYQDFYVEYRDLLKSIALKDGKDGLEERITKLHSSQTTEKTLRDKTRTKVLPNRENKKVINFFMDKYRHKYEKYIEAYDSIKENPKILEIPEFKVVHNFVSKILIVMEWYFNTNNIPYKRRFFGKVTPADSSCVVCGAFFKRKNISQIACSGKCISINKKMLKRRGRKTNKDYGA